MPVKLNCLYEYEGKLYKRGDEVSPGKQEEEFLIQGGYAEAVEKSESKPEAKRKAAEKDES